MNDPSAHHIAYYHLPGLFENYALYARFLPLYRAHREYFYDGCDIGSIYGAPEDCLWSGGRISDGTADVRDVLALLRAYGISGRLTFSNTLLQEAHLANPRCNLLCQLFSEETEGGFTRTHSVNIGTEASPLSLSPSDETNNGSKNPGAPQNGVIVASDLLARYLQKQYPSLYLVSSTTKVLTHFDDFEKELARPDFRYVVPDFRLNKSWEALAELPDTAKAKVEFLANECCDFGCTERKACYEAVSRIALGLSGPAHHCHAPHAAEGYRFSLAMKNPGFISLDDIQKRYLPMGFSQFKIEGRGLGSALILEFLLYYMTRPEHQLEVREALYLDNMLDLF